MPKIILSKFFDYFGRIQERLLVYMLQNLGQRSLKNLQRDAIKAAQVQQNVLMDILKLQKNTEYGRRFNFAVIKTVANFQSVHPLSTYENYRYIIDNIASQGNFAQLVSEPIMIFQETSGTSGKFKLIPTTKRLFSNFQKAFQITRAIGEPYYLNQKAYKTEYRGLALFSIRPLSFTASGVPQGSLTAGGLTQSKFIENLIRLRYTSPPCIFLISNYRSACYCHLLFGLLRSDITYITANFALKVLEAMQTLERLWPRLVNDIEYGRIDESLELDTSIREKLQSLLKPNPALANALRTEFEKGFNGILTRIWSQLSYIECITTGSMHIYKESLRFYAGDIPFYSPGYGATESFIGVNLEPERDPPSYVITPRVAFFEFIPVSEVDKDMPNTINLTSLSIGESYEIVVTTVAGLYRYRLGDVVKCVGYYHKSPIVEFLYRQGSLLSLYSERVTENTIFVALTEAIKLLGNDCKLVDYTTRLEISSRPWRYVIYAEISKTFEDLLNLKLCQDKIEQVICDLNEAYMEIRNENRIGPIEIKLVQKDTFEMLKNIIIFKGTSDSQFKMSRLVKDSNQVEFLETRSYAFTK
ncbi:GH3 auxin-responsive promoter family protein [Nostoc sp.]|uniref:GH3 auxin-responsive promoter family protein n=1 Tax=Nostoc sp. TaxID=1180 RepID=UPI002FFCE84B